MTEDEKKALLHIVKRYAELNDGKKAISDEQKELAEAAWEKCGVQAKAIKRLAREFDWDNIERLAQKQLEESLDECRHALGILADTPLGEAAIEEVETDALLPQGSKTKREYKKRSARLPAEAAV